MADTHTSTSKSAKPQYDPSYKDDPMTGEPLPPKPRLGKDGKAMKGGPYDDLVSGTDLLPGENCWILLGDNLVPTGVQRDPPEIGVLAAPGKVGTFQDPNFHGLVSVTGADLGEIVQPRPEIRVYPAEEVAAPKEGGLTKTTSVHTSQPVTKPAK